jgi:hypothetical protein
MRKKYWKVIFNINYNDFFYSLLLVNFGALKLFFHIRTVLDRLKILNLIIFEVLKNNYFWSVFSTTPQKYPGHSIEFFLIEKCLICSLYQDSCINVISNS